MTYGFVVKHLQSNLALFSYIQYKMNLTGQDWDHVVFRKKQTSVNNKEAVKQALRSGTSSWAVQTVARDKNQEERDRARKIDQEEGVLPKLSAAARQTLIKARTEKGLSQVQLAQQLNVRHNIVSDLETGRVVNESGILQKVRKVLGVSLKFGDS